VSGIIHSWPIEIDFNRAQIRSRIRETDVLDFKSEASYIVFTDGSKYYAKNGSTGVIEYSDADASKVIQYTIDRAGERGGGKVFIKAGLYKLSNTITISKNNIVVEGEGAVTVLQISMSSAPFKAFIINNVSNIVIRHLAVDGNKANLPWTGNRVDYHAIDFYGCNNVVIEGVVVRNCKAGACIGFNSCTNVFVSHSVFMDGGESDKLCDGIYNQNSQRVVVESNIFINLTDTGVANDNCRRVIVRGNHFYNCGSHAFTWYNLSNSLPIPAFGVFIGNIVIGSDVAVWVDRASKALQEPEELIVIGNIITEGSIGLLLNGLSKGIVLGNYIGFQGSSGYGIQLNYSGRVDIFNNIITDVGFGIYFGSGNDGIRVVGNRFVAVANPMNAYGTQAIVRHNIGFDTGNFKATGVSVSIGTNNTYGNPVTITSPSNIISFFRLKITWGGTFASGETVTVKVEAVYTDGSTSFIEKSATATGSLWLTDDDIMSLIAQGKDIIKLNIYAKTNLSSTSVTVTVDTYGEG